MKQTISFVTLGVTDLDKSRRFYKTLGWAESSGSQAEVAFFQVGSITFALFDVSTLFFWILFFGQAKKSIPPTGAGTGFKNIRRDSDT